MIDHTVTLELDSADSDWIKRGQLDLPNLKTADDLRGWLEGHGWTVAQFKRTETYRANVAKLGILRDL